MFSKRGRGLSEFGSFLTPISVAVRRFFAHRSLTLRARVLTFTLYSRSISLTLKSRAMTLYPRSISLTLPARSVSLTLDKL